VEFAVATQQRREGSVVKLSGEVDLYSAPQLRSTLDELVAAGARNIVVDLSDVDFLDSSGLGALIGALKHLRELGHGFIRLAAPAPHVGKILELTGINQVLDVFTTVEAALALSSPAAS
jgi:anti-sigma B factor antagonist